MTKQETAKKIMGFENNWFKHFANFINTDYGMLYYNMNDPTRTDYNHAHIAKYDEISNFDVILQDIKDFYTAKNLTPIVYSNFIHGQREKMKDSLIKNGFIIEENYGGQTYLIHTSECKINVPYTLNFKQISNGEDLSCIYEIFDENDKDDADDITEIKMKLPEFNLFVGFLDDNTPVTMANVEYFNGVGLVDDVETAEKYRGKGYARQMMRFLIEYHHKNYKDNLLYLYYDNPVATRIYKEAGFTEADVEVWAAYIE